MKKLVFIVVTVFFWTSLSAQPDDNNLPNLQKKGTATQLIVDGKPFLMLAGELGNSSASDLKYMKDIWPKLQQMNLNTLLSPVYWELMEPTEGNFDFTLIDELIKDAREYNIKLVLLWFGAWKNSMSCYAPMWVKTNTSRFKRAQSSEGKNIDILSPFSEETMKADAKAFVALMKHLKEYDFNDHTVILVQVENEIGMIPEARDYSEIAQKKYNEAVPLELTADLKKHKDKLTPNIRAAWEQNGSKAAGNWEEIFGKSIETEELFQAWYYAKYTNYIALAGKDEYELPMYVNAALIRKGYKPGKYPSAGPLPHLMNIWKLAAPAVDFMAPDIYFPELAWWTEQFDQMGNAMFIPEAGNNQSMANAFYVIGKHNSMGYSPFSIESVADPENNQVHQAYDVLYQLSPMILEKQGTNDIKAVLLDSAKQVEDVVFDNYIFHVKHEYSWPYGYKMEGKEPRYGCMIIKTAQGEFYVSGTGVIITFDDNSNKNLKVGIGSIDEGTFEKGKWVPGRRLNGDENHQGRHLQISGSDYSIKKLILYTY